MSQGKEVTSIYEDMGGIKNSFSIKKQGKCSIHFWS